jgi:hypothetical protein
MPEIESSVFAGKFERPQKLRLGYLDPGEEVRRAASRQSVTLMVVSAAAHPSKKFIWQSGFGAGTAQRHAEDLFACLAKPPCETNNLQ